MIKYIVKSSKFIVIIQCAMGLLGKVISGPAKLVKKAAKAAKKAKKKVKKAGKKADKKFIQPAVKPVKKPVRWLEKKGVNIGGGANENGPYAEANYSKQKGKTSVAVSVSNTGAAGQIVRQ